MTITSIERMRSLADVGVEDIALVGNRAATLAAPRRAWFPVPEGVVLTTQAARSEVIGTDLARSYVLSRSPKGSAAKGIDREGAEK
jgi:hypothetical protein